MEKNEFVLPFLIFWSFFEQRLTQIDNLLSLVFSIKCFLQILVTHSRSHPFGCTKYRTLSSFYSDLALKSIVIILLELLVIFYAQDSRNISIFHIHFSSLDEQHYTSVFLALSQSSIQFMWNPFSRLLTSFHDFQRYKRGCQCYTLRVRYFLNFLNHSKNCNLPRVYSQ